MPVEPDAAGGQLPFLAVDGKPVMLPVEQLQPVADIENTASVAFAGHVPPLFWMLHQPSEHAQTVRGNTGAGVGYGDGQILPIQLQMDGNVDELPAFARPASRFS